MPAKPTIVVVDTNCFIRLLFSPLRPVLGATFGGYQLMTLADLAAECGPDTEVVERHPWLLQSDVQAELAKNCLSFREPKKTEMGLHARRFRVTGNALLRKHCEAKKMKRVRELSRSDANALAAAQTLGVPLATDEWPLTLVAREQSDVPLVMTSISIVHFMERDGKISAQQRIEVVASWVKHGEALPDGWRDEYRHLFGKTPPDAQS